MIDFQNAAFLKLRPVNDAELLSLVQPLIIPGEQALHTFRTIRDGVVFTDKRIIAVNIQGMTGKKKDFTSLPYNRIQAISVETAGLLDLDGELELRFSGLGKVRFEFISGTDVAQICRVISERIL